MNPTEEEIMERLEACGVNPLRTEERMVKCAFTPVELDELAKKMTEHVLEGARLEDEKKATTKILGDKQKEQEASAQAYAQLYKNGFEEREKIVIIGIDIKVGVRRIIDLDTGFEISTELMCEGDEQTSLNLRDAKAKTAAKPGKKPQAASSAPAVLEIGLEKDRPNRGAVEIDGEVMTESDLANAIEGVFEEVEPDMEIQEHITQIRILEEHKSNPGTIFVTTADKDPIVYFTDKADLIAVLQTAHKTAGWVAINAIYREGDMNHQLVSAEPREMSPTSEDDPGDDIPLPSGVQIGDDIDGGRPDPRSDPDDMSFLDDPADPDAEDPL